MGLEVVARWWMTMLDPCPGSLLRVLFFIPLSSPKRRLTWWFVSLWDHLLGGCRVTFGHLVGQWLARQRG